MKTTTVSTTVESEIEITARKLLKIVSLPRLERGTYCLGGIKQPSRASPLCLS